MPENSGPKKTGQNRTKPDTKTEQTVVALLTSPTLEQAAGQVGISERTLRRWLAEDNDLQAQYRQARHEVVVHGIAQMQQACRQAVDTLREIMTDPKAFAAARVSAAKIILDLSIKVAYEDLEARLSTVEKIVKQRKQEA